MTVRFARESATWCRLRPEAEVCSATASHTADTRYGFPMDTGIVKIGEDPLTLPSPPFWGRGESLDSLALWERAGVRDFQMNGAEQIRTAHEPGPTGQSSPVDSESERGGQVSSNFFRSSSSRRYRPASSRIVSIHSRTILPSLVT